MFNLFHHILLGQSRYLCLLLIFSRLAAILAFAFMCFFAAVFVLPSVSIQLNFLNLDNSAFVVPCVMELRYVKLSENAVTPSRGSSDAAGFDLYAAEAALVKVGGRACVKTDIQLEIPAGCYGRVAPRSGLAVKHGIDVGAGVIDRDFRGNVAVVLFNFGDSDFEIRPGDRVAQLIMERIVSVELVEMTALSASERGCKGFGSSGV